MADRERKKADTPDVPKLDFVGALCEIWFNINYAAYHLAYVRVFLDTAALKIHVEQLRKEAQDFRNKSQVDLIICRAHLSAFFWELDHFFELLTTAVAHAQKEQPEEKYFWEYGRQIGET